MTTFDAERITERLNLRQWIWWYMLEFPCQVWVTVAYRFRVWHARRVPRRGGVLLVANHQSYLDPILIGVAGHRRPFYAMARSSLFHNRFFAWLIGTLRAIPIEHGGTDLTAMRRCMEVLRRGAALLVFPEGARTRDGSVASFASGTMVLIRRTRPTVVPVAIEGAYQAWPRGGRLRAFGRIGVAYGEPIEAETLLALPTADALGVLESRVEALRQEVREKMGRGQ